MTAKELPPIEVLRELYSYSPESGEITNIQTGKVVGAKKFQRGKPMRLYVRMYCGNGHFDMAAHRLALALCGEVVPPVAVIDHIDGNPFNNRRDNLRVCTNQENKRNGDKYRRVFGPQLPKGVTAFKDRFRASITLPNGRTRHLGLFRDLTLAADAFRKAASEFHGEFLRT